MLIPILLFLAGISAGFINTLAGGGSLIVLPVMLLAGFDSITAMSTNRVAILFQNGTGSYNFHKQEILKIKNYLPIVFASIGGAIFGSFFVINTKPEIFDKILGIVLLLILILMLKPKKKIESSEYKKLPFWLELTIFFIVGFYGGYIQAGIGFILLGSLNFIEKFDLVKANAIKVFIVFCYTIPVVLIFAFSGKIIWKYSLLLASGNIIGAYLGVKIAVKKGNSFVRIIILTTIIIACLNLFGIFSYLKNLFF